MLNSAKLKSLIILLLLGTLITAGTGTALMAATVGPELSIPNNIPAQANGIVEIPVTFSSNGAEITSMIFSIDYDQDWLQYDSGVSNAITFTNIPGEYTKSCSFDASDTDGELDCNVIGFGSNVTPLSDGLFLTIKLRTLNAPDGTLAPVLFSADPMPSFGDSLGNSVAGTWDSGSVYFGEINWFVFLPLLIKQTPPPATLTPTPVTPTAVTPTPVTPTPVTPTPDTPTPTATTDCSNILVNGSFEDPDDDPDDGQGWELPATNHTAVIWDFKVHTGDWSLFTGIFDLEDNIQSYSSGYQIVKIPGTTDQATLTFWNYPRSGEALITRLAIAQWVRLHGLAPEAVLANDLQYLAVEDLTAGTNAEILFWQISNSRDWEEVSIDLSAYIGHTIQIWFTTYNDGYNGVTSMFVDDVSLDVCQ